MPAYGNARRDSSADASQAAGANTHHLTNVHNRAPLADNAPVGGVWLKIVRALLRAEGASR